MRVMSYYLLHFYELLFTYELQVTIYCTIYKLNYHMSYELLIIARVEIEMWTA